LLAPLQHPAVSDPQAKQLEPFGVRDTIEIRVKLDLHDAPRPLLHILAESYGSVFGIPLRSVPRGAVMKLRFKDRFEDEFHGCLNDAIVYRRDAERSRPSLGLRNIDPSDGRKLGAVLA